MALNIRRVVTSHDENGRSYATVDETFDNVISRREGHQSCVIWTSDTVPVDNTTTEDMARRKVGTSEARGTVFRLVEYMPGVSPRNHRTDSIDYAVVLRGEITMALDDGEVTLKAGDVLVQRGTMHNWVNNGTEPCVIAFVLVGANPVEAGGQTLDAVG